jgi:hypothetical protein
MRLRKVALLLVVLGILCLPAPMYLGWAAQQTAPPPRTSQVYAAESVDLGTDSGRELVVQRHVTNVALSTHQVSERYSAGEYRAPNETRRTLERAMASGSARTADPAARTDLRRIGQHHAFAYDAYADGEERYFRLRVRENGSLVEATPVSADRIANATAERAAVRYERLSAAERKTVDRVLGNVSTDDGYRPRVDAAFTDRLPALVVKDGALYSLHVTSHVDDFGPGFSGFIVGIGVAGLGVVLILAGGAIALVSRLRDSSDD